jgi:hypothetical protein
MITMMHDILPAEQLSEYVTELAVWTKKRLL